MGTTLQSEHDLQVVGSRLKRQQRRRLKHTIPLFPLLRLAHAKYLEGERTLNVYIKC
jgi:hypothetical protein